MPNRSFAIGWLISTIFAWLSATAVWAAMYYSPSIGVRDGCAGLSTHSTFLPNLRPVAVPIGSTDSPSGSVSGYATTWLGNSFKGGWYADGAPATKMHVQQVAMDMTVLQEPFQQRTDHSDFEEADAGKTVHRGEHRITDQTYYRGKQKYRGLEISEA